MTNDGRLSAWGMAVEAVEAAAKIRTQKGVDPENLPDIYWACLAEADVYARLSLTATEVGFLAGEWLQQREADRIEHQRSVDDLLDRMKRKGDES